MTLLERRAALLILVLALLCQTAVLAADFTEEDELARAAQIGLDISRAGEETISGQDYAALLDHFVNIADPSKAESWEGMFPGFRSMTQPITRAEAFTVLSIAAEIVGGNYLGLQKQDELFALNDQIGEPWDDYLVRWDLFDEAYLEGTSSHVPNEEWTRFATGYFYAMGRYSAFSGERIFAYDPVAVSMHPEDFLNYTDALLSVSRLFDSAVYGKVTDRVMTGEDAAILAQADELRESILNSPSEYTVGEGGTIYYVSPDGNDNNDGKSPETAWKTLDKVNSAAVTWDGMYDNPSFPEFRWASDHPEARAVLEPGDVVLFQRGGQWRGVLRTVSGVTYSAYGGGAKPEILCSPENGAGEEKWTLVEGTTNVWKFYRPLQDCGGIMLECEDGCAVAAKHVAFWDGTKYINVGQTQTSYPIEYVQTCPTMDVTRHLDDLCFFNDIRYSDQNIDYGAFGELYLRCDAGNPGIVYDSIEFFTGNNAWNQNAVAPQNGSTIDNLCICYFSGGVNAQDMKNVTVRNCAFLWGGGFMLSYQHSDTAVSFSRSGDGIMIGGQNNVTENNYVANTFDWGITIEGYNAGEGEDWAEKYRYDCVISGNLVESCCGGILIVSWEAWETALTQPMFTDITIEENYVMHSGGSRWNHGEDLEAGESYLSALGLYLNPGCAGIHCIGNVFYETWSVGPLVRIGYYGDSSPVTLSGNTYVQKNMGKFFQLLARNITEEGSIGENFIEVVYDANAASNAIQRLGDASAVVLDPTAELPVPSGGVSILLSSSMAAAAEKDSLLWLAQYDEKGILIDIQQMEPTAGQIVLFPLAAARQALLLCLDGRWIPQDEAVRIWLGNDTAFDCRLLAGF